jgi:DNA polymerase (family 10)
VSKQGKPLPLKKARQRAEKVIDQLGPLCQRLELAGSVRRGTHATVGDIDLVALVPDLAARQAVVDRIQKSCKLLTDGNQNVDALMADGVQLGVYFAYPTNQEMDLFEQGKMPAHNFGSLLLCRTGSTEHNIHLVNTAKRVGLRWYPYRGLFKDTLWLAGEEEADIFKLLGTEFIEPEERER